MTRGGFAAVGGSAIDPPSWCSWEYDGGLHLCCHIALWGWLDVKNSPSGVFGGGVDRMTACDGETVAPIFSNGGSLFHEMVDFKKQQNGVMEPSSSTMWAQFSLGGVGSARWREAELGFLKVKFWVKLGSGSTIYRSETIYMWERWTLSRTHNRFLDKHRSYQIWLRFLAWFELGKENSCLLRSRRVDEGEGVPTGWAKPRGMGQLHRL
jgi:hypothetical protein